MAQLHASPASPNFYSLTHSLVAPCTDMSSRQTAVVHASTGEAGRGTPAVRPLSGTQQRTRAAAHTSISDKKKTARAAGRSRPGLFLCWIVRVRRHLVCPLG